MRSARRMIVISLVVAAIGARAAAIWILQSHHVPRSTYEHGEIAGNLLAGRGFATHFLGAFGPTSQQAPIYPALVCLAYAIGGVERPQALLLLQMGQAVLAGVLVLGVIRLARSIAPRYPWLAWISGLVTAFHPTLIYAATHVQVALLGTTLLVWTLAWAYQCGLSRRDPGRSYRRRASWIARIDRPDSSTRGRGSRVGCTVADALGLAGASPARIVSSGRRCGDLGDHLRFAVVGAELRGSR